MLIRMVGNAGIAGDYSVDAPGLVSLRVQVGVCYLNVSLIQQIKEI